MEDKRTEMVEMTAAEKARFEAFKAAEKKEREEAEKKEQRRSYVQMIDDELASAIPELIKVSADIQTVKQQVLDNFRTVLDMKNEMFRSENGIDLANKSHTFTNSAGTMRIVIGQYLTDGWDDTAELGVEKIKNYIESLATDEKSKALVSMVMKLLARDAKGTLNAQRILQLRSVAENAGVSEIIEGVKIIVEAYRPIPSKTYIRAFCRDDKSNAWLAIPLGMTES